MVERHAQVIIAQSKLQKVTVVALSNTLLVQVSTDGYPFTGPHSDLLRAKEKKRKLRLTGLRWCTRPRPSPPGGRTLKIETRVTSLFYHVVRHSSASSLATRLRTAPAFKLVTPCHPGEKGIKSVAFKKSEREVRAKSKSTSLSPTSGRCRTFLSKEEFTVFPDCRDGKGEGFSSAQPHVFEIFSTKERVTTATSHARRDLSSDAVIGDPSTLGRSDPLRRSSP